MVKFELRWAEQHYFLAKIEAENEKEAEKKFKNGEAEDFAICTNSGHIENSLEIEEIKNKGEKK